MWFKLKLTPKGGHGIEDITPCSVKFFMHIPKRYLNGQIRVTFRLKYPQVRLKSAIYTPSQDDEHSRHFYREVSKGFTKPLIFLPIFRSFTRYFVFT